MTKKKLSPVMILLIILAIAALAVGGVFIVLYLNNYRYIRIPVGEENGEILYIKYIGTVDDLGDPYQGRIVYTNGLTADVDVPKSEIRYSNGDVYWGELNALEKDGQGKLTYANGDVYEGEFDNGALTGDGKYVYSNGDVYEGDFYDGKKHGEGVYTWSDGKTVTARTNGATEAPTSAISFPTSRKDGEPTFT